MKRGSIVFADITWFLVFVLVAFMLYLTLFRPLEGRMENKVQLSSLETDADFIAATIPQMIFETEQLDGPRSLYSKRPFSALINRLAAEHAEDPDNYERTIAHQDYRSFVESILADDNLEPVREEMVSGRVQRKVPVAYAVVLLKDNKYLEGSCVGRAVYNAEYDFCGHIDEFGGYDPATGALQPEIVGAFNSNAVLKEGSGTYYDVGIAHVPTEHGIITLEAIIQYQVYK